MSRAARQSLAKLWLAVWAGVAHDNLDPSEVCFAIHPLRRFSRKLAVTSWFFLSGWWGRGQKLPSARFYHSRPSSWAPFSRPMKPKQTSKSQFVSICSHCDPRHPTQPFHPIQNQANSFNPTYAAPLPSCSRLHLA